MIAGKNYIGNPSYVIAWQAGTGMSMMPLYMLVAPALLAFVYVDTLWVDANTRFRNHILIRSSYVKYTYVKYVVTMLSGGLAASVPCALLYFIFQLLLPLNYTEDNLNLLRLNVDYDDGLITSRPLRLLVAD
ncbi:hypothetical protein [Paenibacillus popilliae]|nr:hypothetical protein [Paenibacillus popilliae]